MNAGSKQQQSGLTGLLLRVFVAVVAFAELHEMLFGDLPMRVQAFQPATYVRTCPFERTKVPHLFIYHCIELLLTRFF